MTIADYDTLLAEVRNYCGRNDSVFTGRLDTFLALVESRIYDGHGMQGDALYSPPVRTRTMEDETTITFTSGIGTVPSDFIDMRSISRSGDHVGLTFMSPDQLNVALAGSAAGVPYYYTVQGSSIKLAPAWSGDLDVFYYKRFDAVSASNKTGEMIVAHGLLYFNAMMFEAFSFMREADTALAWLARYRSAVEGVNLTALAVRAGGSRMRSIAKPIG